MMKHSLNSYDQRTTSPIQDVRNPQLRC